MGPALSSNCTDGHALLGGCPGPGPGELEVMLEEPPQPDSTHVNATKKINAASLRFHTR
jgi:hypothetical protein